MVNTAELCRNLLMAHNFRLLLWSIQHRFESIARPGILLYLAGGEGSSAAVGAKVAGGEVSDLVFLNRFNFLMLFLQKMLPGIKLHLDS